MDFNKIDIRELCEEAQEIFEVSDQEALKYMFGNCKTIEEINETAKVYKEDRD